MQEHLKQTPLQSWSGTRWSIYSSWRIIKRPYWPVTKFWQWIWTTLIGKLECHVSMNGVLMQNVLSYGGVKVAQLCPTLCDPMDYRVHGILQARILGWLAVSFSRGSSWPRDQTQVSHIAGGFFTHWATREARLDDNIQSVLKTPLNMNISAPVPLLAWPTSPLR